MKRILQWLVVLLMTGALLAGCSGRSGEAPNQEAEPAETPAPAEPAKGGAAHPAGSSAESAGDGAVTQKEIDMAQGVLVLYFDAVVNQDRPLLNFLSAVSPATKTVPVPTGSRTATMQEIKVVKAYIQDGVPAVQFETKVDLGDHPGGTWSPGVNHRWVEVVKTSNGWKIKSVSTSPFAG